MSPWMSSALPRRMLVQLLLEARGSHPEVELLRVPIVFLLLRRGSSRRVSLSLRRWVFLQCPTRRVRRSLFLPSLRWPRQVMLRSTRERRSLRPRRANLRRRWRNLLKSPKSPRMVRSQRRWFPNQANNLISQVNISSSLIYFNRSFKCQGLRKEVGWCLQWSLAPKSFQCLHILHSGKCQKGGCWVVVEGHGGNEDRCFELEYSIWRVEEALFGATWARYQEVIFRFFLNSIKFLGMSNRKRTSRRRDTSLCQMDQNLATMKSLPEREKLKLLLQLPTKEDLLNSDVLGLSYFPLESMILISSSIIFHGFLI